MAQFDLLTTPTTHFPPPPPPPSDMLLTPKAEGAYKTIREVSEEIDVPQHVLRFWESRFPQVKPSRMRGSRRYYRPEDVETLKTIKTLLYSKGFTINGAKKVVRGKEAIPESPVSEHEAAPSVATVVAAPEASVVPEVSVAAPAATEATNIDTTALLDELRTLKSMLVTLL